MSDLSVEHAHRAIAVQVWVDVDSGIADMVRDLNAIPGVRTFASCEGGGSYEPYVMAWWPDAVDAEIRKRYRVGETGAGWAIIHAKSEREVKV